MSTTIKKGPEVLKLIAEELASADCAPARGSADLDMMQEWASSLGARLTTIDLRHADIALEWFYRYAKSHISRAEELRAIEAVSKLSPPNAKDKP